MNSPRQQTPAQSHCKGQTGTWPSEAVKKEQKVQQEVLVCLSTPPWPSTALTCTSCCSSSNLRKEIRCGEETSPLTLLRGEGTAAASVTATTSHGNSFPSSKETPWKYPTFFLVFLKSGKLKTDQRAYPSYHCRTLEVTCCCSAQLSLIEPPKEKENKSHTVVCHEDSQASISDILGIKTCLNTA